jgi:hypothetical protein
MAQPDRSGEHRAALLEQETQVGAQRRPQRKDQSQDHRGILALDEKKIGELALGLMDKLDQEVRRRRRGQNDRFDQHARLPTLSFNKKTLHLEGFLA